MVAVVLKFYPLLIVSLGLSHLFGLHAIILMVGICFVIIAVPETRGLSLTQLAELFGQKSQVIETKNKTQDCSA